ncbi:MAG: LamG domain protein jellyroll fold domain protein [Ilumatobacteraceae bacterium]|nr:LamG domain protein jellyroll fold domain protein [Ilumatobacteraceae bacterium]
MGSAGGINRVRQRPGGVAVLVLLVVAALIPQLTSNASATDDPAHWQQAPLASWRVDGTAYTTLVVGNTVYVGGDFSTVRSPNGATVAARTNLAAFDLDTGALRTGFQANTNGIVRTLVSSGSNLFVGGSFSSVRGVARGRLAAVDRTTGALSPLVADTNSNVYSLAIGPGRLYVGGSFTSVRGVPRSRLAALDLGSFAVTSYAPSPDGTVLSLAAAPSGAQVYAGGTFATVGGAASAWLVKTNSAGTRIPTTWDQLQGPPLDLEVSPDGSRLATAQAGGGNQGAWYDAADGRRIWRQRCDGDGQAVHIVDGTMLTGFHEACDGDATQRLTANDTADGARDQAFRPTFDRFWGIFAIDGDADHLVVAGDFTSISGVPVRGFAIFTRRVVARPPVQLSGAARWRYLVTATTPAATWNQPGFADGAWPSGPAQLGYGDGDEATTVGFGGNAGAKHLTTYFRTTFDALAVPSTLTLNLLADDGAAVYLNGVEVARDNLPPGALTSTTRATAGRSGVAEATVRSFALPPGRVRVGTNTIAVEVHQDNGQSSDLSFAASLTSTGTVPPPTTAAPTTTAPTTTAPTTTTTVPAGAVLYTHTFGGAGGAPWAGWATSAVAGSATIQLDAGQLAVTDTAGAYARGQLTAVAARRDAQVRFSYRWSSTTAAAYLNVYSRGSGGWANAYRPRSGYGVELASNSPAVSVRRVSGGSAATLRTVGAGQAVTTAKQWLALRVVGTTIQFKTWVDGRPEPAAWTSTDVDAGATAPGQLFVSLVRAGPSAGANAVTIDDLRISAG